MGTISALRGFSVPTVAGDVGTWGGELNTTIGDLDTILGQTIVLPSTTYGAGTTLTSSQGQSARVNVSGTPGGVFQLNLPSSNFCIGQYNIINTTTDKSVVLVTGGSSVSGGGTVIVPGSTTGFVIERSVFSDGGGNVYATDSYVAAAIEFAIGGSSIVPSTGVVGWIEMPFQFIAQRWTVISDGGAGSAVTWDIFKSSYSNYPGGLASVTGSSFPVATAGKGQGTPGAAWTPVWNPGDIVEFILQAVSSNFTKSTVSIAGLRSL